MASTCWTPAEISAAQARITANTDAWRNTAWNNEKAYADSVVGSYSASPPDPDDDFSERGDDSPYSPGWFPDLYLPGLQDGHAALSCAIAYRITGTTSYATKAMEILNDWRTTYTHPAESVGHYVAETVGFAIKMFFAADLLRDFMSGAELIAFKAWSLQWMDLGKVNVDSMRDNPWGEPDTLFTVGGHTYSEVYGGNDVGSQLLMAAAAACVSGGSVLTNFLNWVTSHTTPGSHAFGWNEMLDSFIMVTAHSSGGMHSGSAGVGETVEGHLRQSLGYGLYHWGFMATVAEIARRAGHGTNFWTTVTPNGASLALVGPFYEPFLQADTIAAAEAFYDDTNETFGAGNGTPSEYRAYFEMANQSAPAGTLKTTANNIVTWGGNAKRGANYDGHLFLYALQVFGELGSATTQYGQVSRSTTFTKAVSGAKKTFGVVSLGITVNISSIAEAEENDMARLPVVAGDTGAWGTILNDYLLVAHDAAGELKSVKIGAGTPEGSVTGSVGDLYRRTDGGTGTTLYIKESGSGNTGWQPVSTAIQVNTQTGTSYTLAITDAGKIVEMNNAGANTLTIPPNASVAYPIGTIIEVCQYGAGQTTIAPGAGVTINSPNGLKLFAQYSSCSLRKRGTNEWLVVGDTTP